MSYRKNSNDPRFKVPIMKNASVEYEINNGYPPIVVHGNLPTAAGWVSNSSVASIMSSM